MVLPARMKKAVVLFCVLVASVWAKDSFWDRLTPEQRAKAGLENLTPEQRAALDVLADDYASRESTHAVVKAREQAIAETKAVAKAEAKAAAKAEMEAEKKARVGLQEKPDANEVIRAKLIGTFRAWGPGAVFALENGQIWIADKGTEERFFGRRDNVEVEIRPSTFGTWKLFLQPEGLWIRVKRIK